MKKNIKFLFLSVLVGIFTFAFFSCIEHEHSGGAATCIARAVCTECGEEYGDIGDHSFENEICIWCEKHMFSSGLEYTLNSDGLSYSVTSIGTCTDSEVLIRSEYEGLPVTRVGESCFASCQTVRSVVIPEGVTYVGINAFDSCQELLSITLPSTLAEFHQSAFYRCLRLIEVVNNSELDIRKGSGEHGGVAEYAKYVHSGRSEIKELDGYLFLSVDGINYLLDYVGDSTELVLPQSYFGEKYEIEFAFYLDYGLTKVTVTEGVSKIGRAAFFYCTGLTEVIIPEGVTEISAEAFYGCESLTELVIPEGVKRIGELAFSKCTGLIKLILPSNLDYFGDEALSYNEALEYNEYKNALYLGNEENPYVVLVKATDENILSCEVHENTEFITSSAFLNCNSLSSVTVPEGVKGIGGYAFYGCESLEDIVIPDTVELIGAEAFCGCKALKSMVMGSAVRYIGAYAFSGCDSLSGTESGGAVYIGSRDNPYYALLRAKNTSVSEVEVHPDTKIICSQAFRQCAELTQINIPEGVVHIGKSAFIDCASLYSIVLPDSIDALEGGLFIRCSSLTSVILGDNVKRIGEFAFMDCDSLSTLVFGTSVEDVTGIAYGGQIAVDVYYKGTEDQWYSIKGVGVFRYSEVHFNYVP